jgi:O-acetylserine/cysteine efflux transporter
LKPSDILLAIAVPLIWGGGFLFAKAAIEHFPPILLMALRFSLTALVLEWFVPRPDLDLAKRIFLVALVSAAIQYSLTFTGLKGLHASTAIIIVQLEVPFGVLCATVFLGDKLQLKHLLGIGLAFLGVVFIAGEPHLEDDLASVLLVAAGAATWAVGQVMVKTLGRVGGFSLIAWVAVFAAPQLFLSSWLFEYDQMEYIAGANPLVWSAVVYMGLVMTALGYGIWYHLLGHFPVNQVMPFLLLLPVFTVAGGVLILGESPTPRIILGGVLAITGVAIINLLPTRASQAVEG